MRPLLFPLLLLMMVLPGTRGAAASRPNVILIMADDLGYETIGANGGTSYRTPVLDRLAGAGARFTQCYAQPLCTPTRVQLMTGQSNARNYIRFGEMDPGAVTFAQILRQAGYATCIVGKWQLGQDPGLPRKLGFDEHCLWQHTRRPPRYANPGLDINGVEKDFANGEYGPELVNDYALDFLQRKRGTPFLLYYPMILTHAPYQPTPDSRTWDPKAVGEEVNRRPQHFGDMVEYMDKMIGRLIDKLDELGLRDNTLVLFLGDNGTGRGTPSRMGERTVVGGKGRTVRTGMHVPLIVHWPGHVLAGRVHDDLVDTTDFLPTICAAAGVPLPPDLTVDGRSFLPQLRGEPGRPREWIYSWYSPRQGQDRTVREFAFNPRFKLYRDGAFFDLDADPEETRPSAVGTLTGDAAAAARSLQSALDRFRDVRPAHLDAGRVATPAGGTRAAVSAGDVAPAPGAPPGPPREVVYQRAGGRDLRLWIDAPAGWSPADRRPAVVFFFGGGFVGGTPEQFRPQSEYLATRGVVGVRVEYRTLARDDPGPPAVCWADARSAMRYVRAHAAELGVDPGRIAAAGGSAGGHLAAFTALVPAGDDPGNAPAVSCRPDALVLFNPVLDNGPGQWGHARLGDRYREFSPAHNVSPDAPPALVFLGDNDRLIPLSVVRDFEARMKQAGVRCDTRIYPGAGHGFFNRDTPQGAWFTRTLLETDRFLASLGWVEGEPTLRLPSGSVTP